jgi:hypothetical protein
MIPLTFFSAITLSVIAAYYSVIGLSAIFPGSFLPIVFMGGSLELAKLVTASWLYNNWKTCSALLKVYLTTAVVILMLITSMGIFGFLSKAHLEQSAELTPLSETVQILDEKIKNEKSIIETNRRTLNQMDNAVEQMMSRSTNESGASRAIMIRKTQQKERNRLLEEINVAQKKINSLYEEKNPISVKLRKVESDFGPIKYVAELIYGSSEKDIIDKAVRLVIVIIMLVFDPLAVLLLVAANMSMKQKTVELEESVSIPEEVKEEPKKRRAHQALGRN